MSDMEELENERNKFEVEHLAQDVVTGAMVVTAATLLGPVSAVGAVAAWAVKSIVGKNRRDDEWEG
jgi:hypothetical protein